MSEPFGSDSGEVGTDSGVGASPVETNGVAPESQPAQQGNPAWKDVLELIPTEWHSRVTPHFEKWDKSYQELAQQYAPFKQFSGYDPQALSQAWQIREMINTNPQELYRRMQVALEQQGQGQPAQQQGQYDVYDEPPGEEGQEQDPRYAELKAQQQQLATQQQQIQQFLQNQVQEQQTVQATNVFRGQVERIRQADPNVDVPDMIQRAMAMVQMGQEPNMQLAYQQQQEFLRNAFQKTQSTAGQYAPNVAPTNGGIPPSAEKSPVDYTQDERVAAFGAMLKAASKER